LDGSGGVRWLQSDGLATIEALRNSLEGIEFLNALVVDEPDLAADSLEGVGVRHQSWIAIEPVQAVSWQRPRLTEKPMAGKEVVRFAAPLERPIHEERRHGCGRRV